LVPGRGSFNMSDLRSTIFGAGIVILGGITAIFFVLMLLLLLVVSLRPKTRLPHENYIFIPMYVCGTMLIFVMGIGFSWTILEDLPVNNHRYNLVGILLSSTFYWSIGFHILFAKFGYRISAIKVRYLSVFFINWLKCIDYVYLTIGALGFFRTVIGIVGDSADNGLFTAYSTVGLGIALALRISKTSAEVFSWDKSPQVRSKGAPLNS
jgi:hypothetical protein